MAAGADPASINIFGESSLYIAAKTGSTEMVQVSIAIPVTMETNLVLQHLQLSCHEKYHHSVMSIINNSVTIVTVSG